MLHLESLLMYFNQALVQASYFMFQRMKSKQGYMLLKCIRRYIVLDVLAGLEVHMEGTLRLYAAELVKYSETIQVSLTLTIMSI